MSFLVIVFPLIEELEILRELQRAALAPLQVVSVSAPLLAPVDLFQTKDFGDYLMARAANMKITIAKNSRRIVNISGGGCPDVPYLAQAMIGKTLDQAPRPRELGHTYPLRVRPGAGLRGAFAHMIGVVGTVPDLQFPLVHGKVRWAQGQIRIDGRRIPVNRCTPALLAAALRTANFMGGPEVYAFLVGDIGKGDGSYDFFTPDAGELAFLADELAPHPFYTRGFILHQDNKVPDLIRQAYANGNAADCLVVKGAVDHIARGGQVVRTVDRPCFEAMEAIGGTGDSLTGILAALCGAGFERIEAAVLAARVNRWTGTLVDPTPATQVAELIDKIPQALDNLLRFSEKEQIQHGRY